MIQIGIRWYSNRQTGGELVLNRKAVKKSIVRKMSSMLPSLLVTDTAAVTLLVQCQVADISKHFSSLTFPLPEAPHKNFNEIEMKFEKLGETDILRLEFKFDPYWWGRWAKPWSIPDFAFMLKRVIEDRNIPVLCYRDDYRKIRHIDEEPVLSEFSLIADMHNPEGKVQQVLQYWLPIIKDVCEEAEETLATSTRKGALVALFRFAPEVKTACEQYLLYFGQFLEDLGIQATVDLREQARGVLFSVTPESGPEALERIREALDVYLQIPRSPDFDAEVTLDFGHSPRNQIAGKWQPAEGLIAGAWEAA